MRHFYASKSSFSTSSDCASMCATSFFFTECMYVQSRCLSRKKSNVGDAKPVTFSWNGNELMAASVINIHYRHFTNGIITVHSPFMHCYQETNKLTNLHVPTFVEHFIHRIKKYTLIFGRCSYCHRISRYQLTCMVNKITRL